MEMAVKNRVTALMGEKQARENRVITPTVVANETNLTRQVIHKWINNEISSFRSDMIVTLCQYFECGVGDLLYIEDQQEPSLLEG